MDINELRASIDQIDGELTALFRKRMETAAQIAEYKQKIKDLEKLLPNKK